MTAAASTTGDKAQLVAWQQQPSSEQDIYARAIRPGGLQSTTITYDYDPLYRLTTAVYTGALSATYEYLYDGVGNMTAYTETAGITTTIVSRTFDDANRLLTALDTESGTTSYYWDDNGNLIQTLPPGATGQNPVNAISYGYNQRNLLITSSLYISGTGWLPQAAFAYDGGGDRLQQTDYTSGSPITTTYTNDILGLTQVLVARDGSEQVTSLFGLDLILQDEDSEVRTMLVDGLGSVRVEMVDDAVGTATAYSPYGEVLAQVETSGTVYGFTGEQQDAATGLYYLRARYYDSSLRVFTTRDPWGGNSTLPTTINGYNYANGNPVRFIDPTGYQGQDPNGGFDPNCNAWPGFMKEDCKLASDPDVSPGARLNARERIYEMIVDLTGIAGRGSSGYRWASSMLDHFLNGQGRGMNITFGQGHPFTEDPGVTRATRTYRTSQFSGDEPDDIVPLLHRFIDTIPQGECNVLMLEPVRLSALLS